MSYSFLERLGLDEDADDRAIRRAYARALKQIDQEADPAGFQTLREAYDAALMWLRYRDDEEASDDQVDADATQAAAPAAAAGECAPEPAAVSVSEAQAPIEVARQLAHDVFAEFLARGEEIASGPQCADALVWINCLRHSLDDARMVGIVAREIFEWHVAALLAEGWRPGHEALLVAAGQVFGWNEDRRRVQGLGQAGALLDEAIAQRAIFDLQSYDEMQQQRELIARLRDPSPPGTRELLRNARALELMVVRFPTWLPMITSVPNIVRWRELHKEMPGWKRRVGSIGVAKSAKVPSTGGGANWSWIIFLLILGMVRLGAHLGSGPSAPSSFDRQMASQLVELANQRFDEGDLPGALSKYAEAITKDAGYSPAYSGRALVYVKQGDLPSARTEAALAEKLDKNNPAAFRAKGMAALEEKQYGDALAAFTRAIQIDEGNAFTWYQRARTYEADKQPGRALEDAAEAIKRNAQYGTGPYALRARVLQDMGKHQEAAAEVAAMVSAMPKQQDVYIEAANLFESQGQRRDALAILERGMVALPENGTLLAVHSLFRPDSDHLGKRKDLEAAVRLAPHEPFAWGRRADLEFNEGHYEAAIADYSSGLKEAGGRAPALVANLMIGRGAAKSRLHHDAEAEEDFQAVRMLRPEATALNNMCWMLATSNVALESALTSCNSALAKSPGYAAAMDSKAFVLLRMGRYRDAIATFDEALTLRPKYPASLFGRGVARIRSGDRAGGLADVEAARKVDANIVSEYAGYGVRI